LNGFTAGSEVNPETLTQARLLRDTRNPVVILGRGEINVPLKIRVQRVSKGARAKIEAAGGSVESVE
jgi:large subunit ribosomal protein L15